MYRYFIFLLAVMMATTTLAARDKHRSKHREESSASEPRADLERGRTCLDRVRGLRDVPIGARLLTGNHARVLAL